MIREAVSTMLREVTLAPPLSNRTLNASVIQVCAQLSKLQLASINFIVGEAARPTWL